MSAATAAATPAERARLTRRNRRFGIFSLGLAALTVAAFAVGTPQISATFRLDPAFGGATFVTLPDLVVPVVPTVLALAGGIGAIGILQITRGFGARTNAAVGVAVTLFVVAFLTYAARGASLSIQGLMGSTVQAAVPLTLGALSGVLCERAGVINIAIEGQFLAAAFTAALVGSLTGSVWTGLAAAVVAGALVGALLAVLTIRYRADHIVVGVVLIVLATGLTSFLATQVLDRTPGLNSPPNFPAMPIPLLADVPVIGPILFRQSALVYITMLAVVAVHVGLFHTRWGLRTRSVGEHPRAADTVGINVHRTRMIAVVLGGVVAGLGGGYFTLDSAASFTSEMSSGAGFIALAAMLVGRYRPTGALGAALVFGFATALGTSLQFLQSGVPSGLLLMTPYLATILVVAGLVGRLRMPAADGQPYVKEG